MTIKEIESLSGLTRANIRFYEQQGFLSPERHENGYREYTEEDLEILKKIRLLRMLHVPLSQIHDMADGSQSLEQVLMQHLAFIDDEIRQYEDAKTLCERILRDGKEYEEMNTELYLNELNGSAPAADVWDDTGSGRRFLARMMDLYLIFLIPLFLLKDMTWYDTLPIPYGIQMILTLAVVEPVLLTLFGTTPGKWLMRIRILHRDGRKLNLLEAVKRTWLVLILGVGLGIPILSDICAFCGWLTVDDGKQVLWDRISGSIVEVKKEKPWRLVLYGAITMVYIFMLIIVGA